MDFFIYHPGELFARIIVSYRPRYMSEILYLSIETKARELLGRVLLSAKAAARGYEVYLGDMQAIRREAKSGRPGVYFELSIPNHKDALLNDIRNNASTVVCLCEENIVYPDGKEYCERKVGKDTLDKTSLIFSAGDRNVSHLRQFRPEAGEKIIKSGNPRFDTLLPGYREVYASAAEALRKEYGHYLLVNTNFGVVNPFNPNSDYVQSLIKNGMISDPSHIEFMREFVSYKRRTLSKFQSMLAEISDSKKFDHIIVRPHPVENHEFWKEWGEIHGVDVKYEGSANEWSLGADAILHTGCTTGIEALLLDRPVATFRSEADGRFLTLADESSEPVTSSFEFLEKVDEWCDLSSAEIRERFRHQRSVVGEYISNMEPPLACDVILDEISNMPPPLAPGLSNNVGNGLGRLSRKIAEKMKKVDKRDRQKFPSLSVAEAEAPIRKWIDAGLLDELPRIERVAERTLRFSKK